MISHVHFHNSYDNITVLPIPKKIVNILIYLPIYLDNAPN